MLLGKKKSKSMTSTRKEHNIRLEHFVVSESKEVSKNDEITNEIEVNIRKLPKFNFEMI